MNQYWLAAIEWVVMGVAIWLLWPYLEFRGMLGLFLAFVGFEMHLIWHRRDREKKAELRKK